MRGYLAGLNHFQGAILMFQKDNDLAKRSADLSPVRLHEAARAAAEHQPDLEQPLARYGAILGAVAARMDLHQSQVDRCR